MLILYLSFYILYYPNSVYITIYNYFVLYKCYYLTKTRPKVRHARRPLQSHTNAWSQTSAQTLPPSRANQSQSEKSFDTRRKKIANTTRDQTMTGHTPTSYTPKPPPPPLTHLIN